MDLLFWANTGSIRRLSLVDSIPCAPRNCGAFSLGVRASKESGMRYEVYAGGYPFAVDCRTAKEARKVIRDHYEALREQGRL
jgi:hypothetical protein